MRIFSSFIYLFIRVLFMLYQLLPILIINTTKLCIFTSLLSFTGYLFCNYLSANLSFLLKSFFRLASAFVYCHCQRYLNVDSFEREREKWRGRGKAKAKKLQNFLVWHKWKCGKRRQLCLQLGSDCPSANFQAQRCAFPSLSQQPIPCPSAPPLPRFLSFVYLLVGQAQEQAQKPVALRALWHKVL